MQKQGTRASLSRVSIGLTTVQRIRARQPVRCRTAGDIVRIELAPERIGSLQRRDRRRRRSKLDLGPAETGENIGISRMHPEAELVADLLCASQRRQRRSRVAAFELRKPEERQDRRLAHRCLRSGEKLLRREQSGYRDIVVADQHRDGALHPIDP